MKAAIEETQRRRRNIQEDFNRTHVTPTTIIKDISNPLSSLFGTKEEIDEQERAKVRYFGYNTL